MAVMGTQLSTGNVLTLNPQKSNRVLRRIDSVLLSLLVVPYMLRYMDKVLLNGAAQFGIIQDLHLYTMIHSSSSKAPVRGLTRFSNATRIFYLLGVSSWL